MTKYSGLSWGERLLFKSIVLDLSSKYDFKAKEAISFLMKDMKTSKKKKKKEPRKNNSDRVVVSDTDSEISEFKTETPKVVLSITEQKKVERDKKKAGREAKKARKNAQQQKGVQYNVVVLGKVVKTCTSVYNVFSPLMLIPKAPHKGI